MNDWTGRAAFVALLEDEGVSHLFGNPGTTELPIMDALAKGSKLCYVLGLQESVVLAMADGFARASGELTACNVHVAPGLGNAMGSLYNAAWVGSPIIVAAGQQEQGHGLTEPMLSGPLLPMAEPLVKWAVEVTRLADLPRIVRRAAKIATTAPTGPVFLSLPGDILNDHCALELGQPTRVDTASRPSDATLDHLAERMMQAQRPAIMVGHEMVAHDALAEAAAFASALGAPVFQQTVPHGAHFPSAAPTFMGALSRSQPAVRERLSAYDLLICLGADVLRMSVWSEVEPLPPELSVIHLGERDWEMGKNYPAETAVRCHLKITLVELTQRIEPLTIERAGGNSNRESRLTALQSENWVSRRQQLAQKTDARWRARAKDNAGSPLDPSWLMLRLVDSLPENGIVVEEALVSGRSLLDFLPFRQRHDYFGLASGGIGFAMGGAVGVALAHPKRKVVAIIGDGSAMYSIQALWTAAHLKLPICYVIANNRGYRILKERLVSFHDNHHFIGMDFREPPIDFVALANAMGVPAERIESARDPHILDAHFKRAFATDGPLLLDVMVDDGFGNE